MVNGGRVHESGCRTAKAWSDMSLWPSVGPEQLKSDSQGHRILFSDV